jgi:HSP20 family protein
MAKAAKLMQAPKHEGVAISPARSRLAAFPHSLAERIDDILGERWSPFWPLLRWPEEMGRVPSVDVYEEGDQIVLKAEVPGMKREEIDVHVAGEVITISGKKEREEKVERKDYCRFERTSGEFKRTVPLPAEIQVEAVTAQLKDGVLEIRAPKTVEAKTRSRKIDVM